MKLYKKTCLVCDRLTKNHVNICDDCYSILIRQREGLVKHLKYVDEAYACFVYNQLLQDLIVKYKFSRKVYLASLFSELLIEKIFIEKLHKKIDYMISVPVHHDTLIKRGFNQVEIIEDEINSLIGIKTLKENLVKFRSTSEQARLKEVERRKNLLNAFEVKRPEEIKNKTILLLDDIVTTGSTLDECGKVLKEAGAARVIGLAIGTA